MGWFAPMCRAALLLSIALALSPSSRAEDGYDLWLRYKAVEPQWRQTYAASTRQLVLPQRQSPTLRAAADELRRGIGGLLDIDIGAAEKVTGDGALILGTPQSSPLIGKLALPLGGLAAGGYLIRSEQVDGHRVTVIAANDDIGVLYGAFRFLQRMQTRRSLDDLAIAASPQVERRLLNHWDNLDRSVERGYAGQSIWDWWRLPDYRHPRYTDYARANASIGINGTVLNNVNADADILTPRYIDKAAALAEVFRPYGLRVYLSARFSAPMEIGGLGTADPKDPAVRRWWKDKASEVYAAIPDFGGFLVKANSEGQPGPQDYGRSHADGANMLADALGPHGGVVMWRAFVYAHDNPEDRAKQAYSEFKPLDGQFADNVILQVKNGPIDFQPREPFHPLFGAMPKTPLMMEFQITKEYLGFATHLAYLGPLYEEVLEADTCRIDSPLPRGQIGRTADLGAEGARAAGERQGRRESVGPGPGERAADACTGQATVASVVDGSLHDYRHTGIAGVANIGRDRDWSGSVFNQANWYVFGRLAWNPQDSARAVAEDWLKMTFSPDSAFVQRAADMMMASREAVVDYMTPLGLAHLMATGHHYGPGPWVSELARPEWNPAYYHRADAGGIGFDRTAEGSNAAAQYAPPVAERFASRTAVPEKYLLWFHHLPWDHSMPSGRDLWAELVHRYDRGVAQVEKMRADWAQLEPFVDRQRFVQTGAFLAIQEREARWWRDASIAYFRKVSGRELPEGVRPPAYALEHYRGQSFPRAPGH
ncbi:alpha-glucuronidase family glycosyl hydrolase [Microbulbifer halophilus]|uniref:Xylan alpha-1,2-glucuronidase n=1 Tax=Microbulbifer halophilus TaxID=453963 RepID=A0ABW5E7S2_9GAMM|nr:alpha-glucuronidase family glycosyl hydrolase [Microbulbifer halophilus]MCW8125858.1 alpha-glucuronidase family glycosyl hydrolase [Microbulbifer halophilus]